VRKKIIFLVNIDWFFVSHRLPIAISAIEKGYNVYLLTKVTDKKELLISHGIKVYNIPFERSSKNIFKELLIFFKIFLLYFKIKPDIVHHITMKPIIYGSIAANILKINKNINAFSGLGYLFTNNRKSFIQKIIYLAINISSKNKRNIFIFQNKDDLTFFKENKVIASQNKNFIIKGSGVDLEIYKETPPPLESKIIILFPTRMLWDKGVRELYEATLILKKKYFDKITFILAGMIDKDNISSVPEDFILNWQDGEYVKWIGYKENIIDFYISSDIVVLPSYREGLPKSLIEACAIGRAIITTNAIGCKECVDDNFNGFKVQIGSGNKIAEAIIKLIEDRNLIVKMGKNSRIKAEKEFNLKDVIDKHLFIYSQNL
jgi:glycosyltransferase involved in cell wall biosynthesis